MAFIRTRFIKGRPYTYLEERWREGKKVRSRSTILKGAPQTPRHAAMERYRDVLRANVYAFGRSHPAERYLREAQAREAYHRFLDAEKQGYTGTAMDFWSKAAAKPVSPFEARERMYAVSHPSPAARARDELGQLKAAAEKERAEAKAAHFPPKSTPTDEEEAQMAESRDAAREAADRGYAEYAEVANAEAGGSDEGGSAG